MTLLLLRHGKAEERGAAGGTDFSRALVEKGHQQAREAARVLSAAGMQPDLVLCSPLVRTRQTADAFTMAARLPGAISQSWLSSGMSPVKAVTELASFRDFETVMLIGHEPDFSQFIEYVLGAAGGCVEVRKGSVTCLEINPPFRQAILRFLLPFKLAKHME